MNRTTLTTAFVALVISGMADAADPRNITTGSRIPDEGYCDQPYVVITPDGNWLCTLTTGAGNEGQGGQHVVSTISTDKGKTWSALADIEPATGPAASWVVPMVTPGGRVYAFYTYNGDNVHLGRDDVHGWYAMRYSDDGGRSWSQQRYRLPLRRTACDQLKKDGQLVQMFWGIDKPKTVDGTAYFAFTKLGRYLLEQGEGWLFASDNILTVTDPNEIRWELRPDGELGIRSPDFGSIQEEHNMVPLGGQRLYCVYRTTHGFPCHAYSEDGGRTWNRPESMVYAPGRRIVKTPRACPKLWRCSNGKFLFWHHLNGGPNFKGQYPQTGGLHFRDRNPAWIIGGVLKKGRMHWSQPEILLYAEDPQVRMSYPDLIEQDGRYWVTETQKTIARIHELDSVLLEGTWAQLDDKLPGTPVTAGCVADLKTGDLKSAGAVIDKPLTVRDEKGFALDLWLTVDRFAQGQVLLDMRDEQDRGWTLSIGGNRTLTLSINDGRHRSEWDCDAGMLTEGQRHHVVFVVDGGPNIITVVVDGVLCDGGDDRQFGWGRFDAKIGDVSRTGVIKTDLSGVVLHGLRIYDRYLRTAEVVQNYRAGRAGD